MCGESTVTQVEPGKFECIFVGQPKNLHQIIYAKNRKMAIKIFQSHIRVMDMVEPNGY